MRLKLCLWNFAIKWNIQLKLNPRLQENASLSLNYSPQRGKYRYCITKDGVPFCRIEKDAQSDWVSLILFHGARASHWVWVSSLTRLYDDTQVDTQHSVRFLWTSYQPNVETSSWQHTKLTKDRHACPWRNSNPQIQQASSRRTTPQTARPLGSASPFVQERKLFVFGKASCIFYIIERICWERSNGPEWQDSLELDHGIFY